MAHPGEPTARPYKFDELMSLKLTKVDLVLFCMVLFWGANITIIKVALRHFHPVVFNCLRFVIASLTITFLYREAFRDKLEKKEIWSLLVLGVLGNTVYQFLFIFGVKYSFVSHTSIMLGVTPIFTAGLSKWLRIEDVRGRLWLGIFLSFTGILLVVCGAKNFDPGDLRGNIGDLFVLMASFAWSLYTAFSKKFVSAYSSRHYVLYTMLFGTAFMIPISLPFFGEQNWSALSYYEWGAVVYSALLALVYGYSAWYYGVQRMGSTRTSTYANLTPVAGLIVGMIFLGERLTFLQWIGAAIIFLGLMLNRFAKGSVLQPELNPGLLSTK